MAVLAAVMSQGGSLALAQPLHDVLVRMKGVQNFCASGRGLWGPQIGLNEAWGNQCGGLAGAQDTAAARPTKRHMIS